MTFRAKRTTGRPIEWSWIRAIAAERILPLWFLAMTAIYLIERTHFPAGIQPGTDARVYLHAAEAWLNGGNPWTAGYFGVLFGAPPPTLLFVAPFVPLGETLTVVLWLTGGVALTLWTLRRLGLPFWWIFWAPVFEAVWTANPNTLVIALLVAGGSATGVLAVFTKVYAAVPLVLLGRWRALLWTGALMLVTAPFLPWPTFLDGGMDVVLRQNVGYNATAQPLWLLPVALSLVVLGRRRLPWLAVPAFWPHTQVGYAALALPAVSPLFGAITAIREPWALPLGLCVYAISMRLSTARPRPLRAAASAAGRGSPRAA